MIGHYPNVTAIDTAPILAQIQRVLQQVIGAVQFLFVFTLAAGVLVLYAALAGTRDERMRESALLRALGASHRQVRSVQVAEFVAVGALRGLMAALGAQAIGWVLAYARVRVSHRLQSVARAGGHRRGRRVRGPRRLAQLAARAGAARATVAAGCLIPAAVAA